ncbi:MAG: PAS domain-containing sensor histidine kinase [Elusimicrobiales bacterium]|nr:PAS domain-containing sensor histidine kinase [Elusimicrobiales bacterium]
MKSNSRLSVLLLAVSFLPVLAFFLAVAVAGFPYRYAFLVAAATALAAAGLALRQIVRGVAGPLQLLSLRTNKFISDGYRLGAVIPQEGWREARGALSAANRLMLELSAYRAFHLNEVIEERAKAQALIETISDGVLLVDDRGRLIYSNKLGLTLLHIQAKDPNIVLPGSVRQGEFTSALTGLINSDQSTARAEVSVRSPDDPESLARSYRVITRQFPMATLKRPGRVIVIRDVTVEKEIESSRETFFHMITHDMRAPLSSIQGYTQLLETVITSPQERDKFLQPIVRSARRLNGMIEDILNTIKLERGEMKLHPTSADPAELLRRIHELHEPLAARKRITLSVMPPPNGIIVSADFELLERVITNLVGNALKFTEAGGRVSIYLKESDEKLLFAVEDTGPGIPAEMQNEVFEKYAQMDEHKHLGFGLGLAMCKLAVELHGGRIWVESREGIGSKFFFTLPKN